MNITYNFKEYGLTRDDISHACYSVNPRDQADGYYAPFIKHTDECRSANPRGIGKAFVCECDFSARLVARIFGIAYDGYEY